MDDTICAISTSVGVGAISIVRISGSNAIQIVNKIFKGKDLTKVSSHTINYGYIVDKDKEIDEVLVSVMKAPKTFTTEDVVEINCHGGVMTTNLVLKLLLLNGARLAEPGEFTKRAYLNGRINLIEAEGISDIINAESESARKLAMNQVKGNLTKTITECRDYILDLLANIEVNIDYPEYEDALVITHDILTERIKIIKEKISNIINESKNSKIIKNGIDIVFVGRPNVGKSSLLNCFLDENKAIVTNIAGTTRDIVEGSVLFNDIKFNLIDTAGIRETSDPIEKIGVDKSREKVLSADLVVIILNQNEKLTEEDQEIINYVKSNNKKFIIFINKDDLDKKLDLSEISNYNLVYGNTLSNQGILPLKEKIVELFNINEIETKNLNYLSNIRQISLAEKCLEYLNNAEQNNNNDVPVDMVEIDLRSAWDSLGEIIGETYNDELLDNLFSKFCLGK